MAQLSGSISGTTVIMQLCLRWTDSSIVAGNYLNNKLLHCSLGMSVHYSSITDPTRIEVIYFVHIKFFILILVFSYDSYTRGAICYLIRIGIQVIVEYSRGCH